MRQYRYDVAHMLMANVVRLARGRVALLGVIALVAAACGNTDTAKPVAKVSLEPSKKDVALGGVLDLTYRFVVAPDARPAGDYRVFVHLNREDGTMIWNDDHELPAQFKTSTWQSGQTIEYTRTRFMPMVSYVGPATFEVGLYHDDDRLPLEGMDPADKESAARSYKVATINLLPRSETSQVAKLSGWHGPEYSPEDPTVDWQWTQKAAVLTIKNPKRDVTFYLEYDARSDVFGSQPQQVTVSVGETPLATFAAGTPTLALQRIPVTAAQLGTGETAEFRIEVDRTFVPARALNAGTDVRELGIRVYHAVVEPR
ncbi:MAG TPA: hypothetical protein VFV78_11930 [Vicinamibacterales bacterium]|nr:hypothetical protein [Vicinamibacterales bacterium]